MQEFKNNQSLLEKQSIVLPLKIGNPSQEISMVKNQKRGKPR